MPGRWWNILASPEKGERRTSQATGGEGVGVVREPRRNDRPLTSLFLLELIIPPPARALPMPQLLPSPLPRFHIESRVPPRRPHQLAHSTAGGWGTSERCWRSTSPTSGRGLVNENASRCSSPTPRRRRRRRRQRPRNKKNKTRPEKEVLPPPGHGERPAAATVQAKRARRLPPLRRRPRTTMTSTWTCSMRSRVTVATEAAVAVARPPRRRPPRLRRISPRKGQARPTMAAGGVEGAGGGGVPTAAAMVRTGARAGMAAAGKRGTAAGVGGTTEGGSVTATAGGGAATAATTEGETGEEATGGAVGGTEAGTIAGTIGVGRNRLGGASLLLSFGEAGCVGEAARLIASWGLLVGRRSIKRGSRQVWGMLNPVSARGLCGSSWRVRVPRPRRRERDRSQERGRARRW